MFPVAAAAAATPKRPDTKHLFNAFVTLRIANSCVDALLNSDHAAKPASSVQTVGWFVHHALYQVRKSRT